MRQVIKDSKMASKSMSLRRDKERFGRYILKVLDMSKEYR